MRSVSRAPGAAHENTPFFKTHCPSPKHRLIRSLGPRGAIFNFLASAPRASAFDRRAGRAVPRRPGASGGLNQRLRAVDRPRGPRKWCDDSVLRVWVALGRALDGLAPAAGMRRPRRGPQACPSGAAGSHGRGMMCGGILERPCRARRERALPARATDGARPTASDGCAGRPGRPLLVP